MRGIEIVERPRILASDPARVDIALFVGFFSRRKGVSVDDSTLGWLRERRYFELGPNVSLEQLREREQALLDVPVPIDAWAQFERLFAWELRSDSAAAGADVATYTGAAVRSFFAQGGRRCYVVRVDEPWSYVAPASLRRAALRRVLPPAPAPFEPSPQQRTTWSGLGHVFGLDDVSFVAFPDLAEAVAGDVQELEPEREPPQAPEIFVECSNTTARAPADQIAPNFAAPRCDEVARELWARHVRTAAEVLARHAREVQLIAAVPLAVRGTDAEREPLAALLSESHAPLARNLADDGAANGSSDIGCGIASAFVQLVHPWLRTPGSARLPERLESPEGAWLGLLASNALTRGTYRSIAGTALVDVTEVEPVLTRGQSDGTRAFGVALAERVSLLGPTPNGLGVLSDVSAALDPNWRPACVTRLTAAILRAARRLGEELAFEPSGERLWARVVDRLRGLFLSLLRNGALRGDSPADAFSVRCDRTTMTQADIDAGRVIALASYQPAAPIERITVVLSLVGGEVALEPVGRLQELSA